MTENKPSVDGLGLDIRDAFETFNSIEGIFAALSEYARRLYAIILNVPTSGGSEPIFVFDLLAMSDEVGISVPGLRSAFAELDLVAIRLTDKNSDRVQVMSVCSVLSYFENEAGDVDQVMVAIPDLGLFANDVKEVQG